jgi:hypothetical protein
MRLARTSHALPRTISRFLFRIKYTKNEIGRNRIINAGELKTIAHLFSSGPKLAP